MLISPRFCLFVWCKVIPLSSLRILLYKSFFEEMSNVTSILYIPEFFQKLVVRCLGLVVKYKLSPEFAPAAESQDEVDATDESVQSVGISVENLDCVYLSFYLNHV
ncbi:uncharacterized protein LOC123327091 [Drosophila simulans]|uniref:uncharacterized protein LOC123327091 n=1 Tax=Drosophila simulans TaxID=7240 RepID=UPI001D108FDC|nr:uncharacterized protein LOC123327091 [Drosophila simulans]